MGRKAEHLIFLNGRRNANTHNTKSKDIDKVKGRYGSEFCISHMVSNAEKYEGTDGPNMVNFCQIWTPSLGLSVN